MADINQPIDIYPIKQSSTPAAHHVPAVQNSNAKHSPDSAVKRKYFTYTDEGGSNAAPPTTRSEPAVAEAHVINADGRPSASSTTPAGGRISGAASFAVGGVCALVGVPLLILPGPGLLLIGGGAMLMARGARKLFGTGDRNGAANRR